MLRIAALVLTLAVLALFLIRFGGGDALEPAIRAGEASSHEAQSGAAGPLVPLTVQGRREVAEAAPAIEAGRAAAADADAAPPANDEALLIVRVFGHGGRTGLAGARVCLSKEGRSGRIIAGNEGRLGDCVTGDREGQVVFRVPPNLELRGWVDGVDVGHERESFTSPGLAPGSTHELLVTVKPEEHATYYGRVVDRETGESVAGATLARRAGGDSFSLSLGSEEDAWDKAKAWSRTADPVAATDLGGEFNLPVRSMHPATFEVHADGYGPAWVQPSELWNLPERAEVVRISRTATVHGTVSPPDLESGGVVVGLLANAFALRDRERGTSIVTFDEFLWQAEVGKDGSFRVENLPAHTSLRLEVHSGPRTLHRAAEPLILEPGEERLFDWRSGSGSRVEGRLEREDGERARPTEMWLVPAPPGDTVAAVLSRYEEPVLRTSSDDSGRFVFEDVAPGSYFTGPAPSARRRESPCYAVRVDAPTSAVVVVTIPVDLFIEGTVVLDGVPVAGASLYGSRSELRGGPRARADERGVFRLGPLLPGLWTLRVTPGSSAGTGYTAAEPVEALAGARDVELAVTPSASIAGSIVDGTTGDPAPAAIMLKARGAGSEMRTGDARATFNFANVSPGTYAIHAWTSDGRTGIAELGTLGPGDARSDVLVELAPGAIVRVRAGEGASRAHVGFVQDGVEVASFWVSPGLDPTVTLPPGTYSVTKRRHYRAEAENMREVTLAAGDELALEIEFE